MRQLELSLSDLEAPLSLLAVSNGEEEEFQLSLSSVRGKRGPGGGVLRRLCVLLYCWISGDKPFPPFASRFSASVVRNRFEALRLPPSLKEAGAQVRRGLGAVVPGWLACISRLNRRVVILFLASNTHLPPPPPSWSAHTGLRPPGPIRALVVDDVALNIMILTAMLGNVRFVSLFFFFFLFP